MNTSNKADDQLSRDRELAFAIDVSSGLSSWEAEFVDSILKQLKGGRPMTPAQRTQALRIQQKLDRRAGR